MRKRIKSLICRSISALVLVFFAQTANAVPVIQPAGLNTGDPYRLMFTTSTERDATSINIADYNAFVSGVANGVGELAGLGTTWTAVASTGGVSARDNTGTQGVAGPPIYNLNGEIVATDYGNLWNGDLDNALFYDENGSLLSVLGSENHVWTGTSNIGAIQGPLGDANVQYGFLNSTNSDWTQTNMFIANSIDNRLYAMSGTLSAVPLPPAAALLGLPLVMLMRRRGLQVGKGEGYRC